MSDWKPIDCAPVHEAILVYDEEMGICTAKKTQSGLWSYPNSDDFQFTKCNDWMPLPQTPKILKHKHCHDGSWEYTEQG